MCVLILDYFERSKAAAGIFQLGHVLHVDRQTSRAIAVTLDDVLEGTASPHIRSILEDLLVDSQRHDLNTLFPLALTLKTNFRVGVSSHVGVLFEGAGVGDGVS